MKFPLFSRKRTILAPQKDPQAEVERLLAQSFRVLGQLMSKMADAIDHGRLERQGYRGQEQFLERIGREQASATQAAEARGSPEKKA